MFLEITKLKKLMSEAYKGAGLMVGSNDINLTVTSGWWGFSLEHIYIPKKLKGALAELIGDLPENGEAYRYTREETSAVEDFFDKFDFYDQWHEARNAATITPVVIERYGKKFALIQMDSSYRIIPIFSALTDMIGIKDMDFEHESEPGKPCTQSGRMFYWHNGIMVFAVCAYSFDEKADQSLLTYLSHIDFSTNEFNQLPSTAAGI